MNDDDDAILLMMTENEPPLNEFRMFSPLIQIPFLTGSSLFRGCIKKLIHRKEAKSFTDQSI